MNDKLTEQLRDILGNTPELKDEPPGQSIASLMQALRQPWIHTAEDADDIRARCTQTVAAVRLNLEARGFGSMEAAAVHDLRHWRRQFDSIQPRPSFIGVTAADARRRAVRSTFEILSTEIERTAQLIDHALYCGCPHCIMVKLPEFNRFIRFEMAQIEYWLDWETHAGWNR